MKKAVIVLSLLVSLLAVPQMLRAADNNSLVWINNSPKNIDIIQKDSRIYVPIRAVAENLNCKVTWKDNQVHVDSILVRPQPPEYADDHFRQVFNQAMDLLEQKDPADYAFVCQNVRGFSIERLPAEDGSLADCIGGSIGFTPNFINDPERFTPEYLAAVLVHETCHVAWRETSTDRNNPQNEVIAYSRGILCMELVGAPQWAIDETRQVMKRATGLE